ncbi:Hypothetical predicted protein [Mytilus galloprovincialis]|uniref:DDE Tnp4 domain-containing protein n=1 Tax=Mytilus galloprovincialis TaxID=29158 RepID=A0A8B6HRJ7_MYTGA|nr:Hypothetical predicted protein [Mytilus galloprovincialis]
MAAFRQVPVAPHRKERHFRLKDDLSLNLSNEELRERYRFGRDGINFISNLVSDDITRKTKRNHALTVPQMVMVTLRFLTTGIFLQVVGDTIGVYLHGTEWWMGKWCTAGDSGYPCRPFLMTPYQNPVLDHQKKYNRCHCSTRSVIERTFGRLKRRFHILHSEIRMIPSKACKIIMACAILHNICILLNEPDIEDDGLVIDNDGDLGDRFFGNQDGRGVRDHISSTFFNR